MENNPPWRLAGTVSIVETGSGVSDLEQIAGAVRLLVAQNGLRLPDGLLRQMEDSILRALQEQQLSPPEPNASAEQALESGLRPVQLGMHLISPTLEGSMPTIRGGADEHTQPGLPPGKYAGEDRWGFFLVQKRGGAAEEPRTLHLDLFLYQE